MSAPATDTTPPTASISTPTTATSYSTTSSSINVSGTAADNVGVTQVRWASDRGGSGVANGTTSWSVWNFARERHELITITAFDAAGNQGTDSLTVTYATADTTSHPDDQRADNGDDVPGDLVDDRVERHCGGQRWCGPGQVDERSWGKWRREQYRPVGAPPDSAVGRHERDYHYRRRCGWKPGSRYPHGHLDGDDSHDSHADGTTEVEQALEIHTALVVERAVVQSRCVSERDAHHEHAE